MGNKLCPPTGLARFACVVLAAVLVACADDITRPRPSGEQTLQPMANVRASSPSESGSPRAAKPPTPDVVIMERTTDIAAREGHAAKQRKLKRKLIGQIRPEKVKAPEERANAPAFDPENLPQPPISLPASRAKSTCAAPSGWKQALRSSAITEADVEIAGFGDAPPSTIRHVKDGKTLFTVERTWVRTPDKWQLERQITTTADGKYRDVVTYQHVTPGGNPVNNAIPSMPCVTSLTGTPQITPDEGSRSGLSTLPFSGDALNVNGEECGSSFDFGSDPCFEKRDNVYKADAALVAAGTLLTYWCHIINPVRTATCLPAATAYSLAVINLKFAQRALVNCLREAQSTTCNCGSQLFLGTGNGASSGSLPSSFSVDNPGYQIAGSYSYHGDPCGYDPAPYHPPGGGGNGGTCKWMDWEISYDDGMTWEYLGTFWTCYDVDVPAVH